MQAKIIHDSKYGRVVRIDDAIVPSKMSNTESTVREIHDILKAYYEVARKRFTDSVCMQAAHNLFVTADESPLRIFSRTFIQNLGAAELDQIVGESLVDRSRKRDLPKKNHKPQSQ